MQSQGVQQSLLHQPSKRYSPTEPTDLHRCRRVWHPAVPTQPLTQPTICVDQCNPWENSIPTERTERTEVSCREKFPTDCTDLHRCRRVWHPAVPTHPLTQPTICVDQCNPWENSIPTERTEPTEASCREEPPTDITDAHRCRRVWHLAVPTQPTAPQNFCEFCEFRGRTVFPQNARNPQKLLVEKGLPQISRMRTD